MAKDHEAKNKMSDYTILGIVAIVAIVGIVFVIGGGNASKTILSGDSNTAGQGYLVGIGTSGTTSNGCTYSLGTGLYGNPLCQCIEANGNPLPTTFSANAQECKDYCERACTSLSATGMANEICVGTLQSMINPLTGAPYDWVDAQNICQNSGDCIQAFTGKINPNTRRTFTQSEIQALC